MLKLFIFSLFALTAYAEEPLVDTATGFEFPRQVTIEDKGKTYRLNATGIATKKAFLLNIYSVAHYLEEGGTAQDILKDGKAKQVTLKYKLNIPADKMGPGISKGLLDANSQAEFDAVKKEVKQYIKFFNRDVKKGDEQVVQWLPGGVLNILINGEKVGTITSIPFAKVVWSQFVGPHGEVKREKLLSLMKST